ncbi:MAG: DUF1893 domain-containing protein [Mediterranea sp.]|jgi:iron complex outermembrane receptor protein|nr:DUF1893 domain-containing protein [Mediterranea sp.]
MKNLIEYLHDGDYSCVIASGTNISAYTGRGVSDLHDLLTRSPHLLKGAIVADKVVGRGAAALLILGGVLQVHANLISTSALDLLREHAPTIDVSFDCEAPYIINRDGTGRCPVETLCDSVRTPGEMLPLITNFLDKIREKTAF